METTHLNIIDVGNVSKALGFNRVAVKRGGLEKGARRPGEEWVEGKRGKGGNREVLRTRKSLSNVKILPKIRTQYVS